MTIFELNQWEKSTITNVDEEEKAQADYTEYENFNMSLCTHNNDYVKIECRCRLFDAINKSENKQHLLFAAIVTYISIAILNAIVFVFDNNKKKLMFL